MPAVKKKTSKANGKLPFRIGRSRTGLGLFATEPIRKGRFIVEYTGKLLTNAQCDAIPDNKYLFEVNARWTVNGAPRANVARYINHSCRGNADPYILRTRQIKIRAIKNIKPGDEITYDYGKDHFNAYIKPHGCKCDSCQRKRARERAEARAAKLRREKRAARLRRAKRDEARASA
jgi:SET domain-containing protein